MSQQHFHFRSYSESTNSPVSLNQQSNGGNSNNNSIQISESSANYVILTHSDSQKSLDRLFNPPTSEASVPLRQRNLPSSFFNPTATQKKPIPGSQQPFGNNLHSRSTSFDQRPRNMVHSFHSRTQSMLAPMASISSIGSNSSLHTTSLTSSDNCSNLSLHNQTAATPVVQHNPQQQSVVQLHQQPLISQDYLDQKSTVIQQDYHQHQHQAQQVTSNQVIQPQQCQVIQKPDQLCSQMQQPIIQHQSQYQTVIQQQPIIQHQSQYQTVIQQQPRIQHPSPHQTVIQQQPLHSPILHNQHHQNHYSHQQVVQQQEVVANQPHEYQSQQHHHHHYTDQSQPMFQECPEHQQQSMIQHQMEHQLVIQDYPEQPQHHHSHNHHLHHQSVPHGQTTTCQHQQQINNYAKLAL